MPQMNADERRYEFPARFYAHHPNLRPSRLICVHLRSIFSSLCLCVSVVNLSSGAPTRAHSLA
jgi:hypothetical protein